MTSRRASAILLVLAVSLAACTGGGEKPAPKSQNPQTSLIGLSRGQLLACAGQPQGMSEAAGAEYLLYRASRTLGVGNLTTVPRLPVIGSVTTGGPGYLAVCEATFVVKDGAVVAVNLRTDPPQDAKTTADLCAPIVSGCSPS